MKLRFGQTAAMSVVTVFAIAVMAASGGLDFSSFQENSPEETVVPPAEAAPVDILELRPQTIEVVQRYSGMIEPRERLVLGFEIPGRIETLGKNANGQVFDEGVRVAAGDVLAVLDTRQLQARKAEADALLAQAEQENDRGVKLRQRNPLAINESELLTRKTTLEIQQARAQLAAEQLRNATLVSPVDGVISKRMLLPGESVNAHQPVFEILQVDRVSLMVGVPESKIAPVIAEYEKARRFREVGADDEVGFQANVWLAGSNDPFQRGYAYRLEGDESDDAEREAKQEAKHEARIGEVVMVSESSDQTTGLFQVEIQLDNRDGNLRPGQIAIAELIVARIKGFEIPSSVAIFEDGKGYLYTVAGPADAPEAKRFNLREGNHLEQKGKIILKHAEDEKEQIDLLRVVSRGQHRLIDGRAIAIQKVNGQPRKGAASSEVPDATVSVP